VAAVAQAAPNLTQDRKASALNEKRNVDHRLESVIGGLDCYYVSGADP
jgi:hypothetical protein